MRLVDADELLQTVSIKSVFGNEINKMKCGELRKILKMIENAPTVEPPRMKGKWETDVYGAMDDGEYLITRCSACGTAYEYGHDDRYCGFCGAEMGGQNGS